MINLSLDIDWAPDGIVEPILDLAESYGIPITVFTTDPSLDASHNSSTAPFRNRQYLELGIHPDFFHSSNYSAVIASLLTRYPDSTIMRPHNGINGWPIAKAAAALGIRTEVICQVFRSYIEPIYINGPALNYIILTTSFFDSQALQYDNFSWRKESLPFWQAVGRTDRIYTISFHPNILYYNMNSVDCYSQLKPTYHQPNQQLSWENANRADFHRGAMDLFLDIIVNTPKDLFCGINKFLGDTSVSEQFT